MEEKLFKIGTILAVAFGKLMCSIDELYEILNYMTDDCVFTHQLPRFSRECAPVLKEQLPFLNGLETYVNGVNTENWEKRLRNIISWVGEYHPVKPCPEHHERIHPFDELAAMVDNS